MTHRCRKPIFWAPGWVPHRLYSTRIQINVSDRLFPKFSSKTYPSCLTASLFTLQHHTWGWICCLSTKALIQHDNNLTFRSSWCLASCICSQLCHKISHCRPRWGWDFWRSHPGAWIIVLWWDLGHCTHNIALKLTHHVHQCSLSLQDSRGRGDLLWDWCGTRCQADSDIGFTCTITGTVHINIGIVVVPLSTTLASRWIIKFFPHRWQLLDFNVTAWVRHVDIWVRVWSGIISGAWGSARWVHFIWY